MAGTVRRRTAVRCSAGFAAVAVVLAAAGSAPAPTEADSAVARYLACLREARKIADRYRGDGIRVNVACLWPDDVPIDPKLFPPVAVKPAPTPVVTVGHRGCVTGPGRPVTATALTSASATAPGEEIWYEWQPLGGVDSDTTGTGGPVLEFRPGDLAPGHSYRWRARVLDTGEERDDSDTPWSMADYERGWSPWCEFTVSAAAVDYTGMGDVSLEALTELGLRPDRTYTVSLSGRQQRLLRAGTDVGRTGARMTLTGPRWTDLLVQLSQSAVFLAENIDGDEDFTTPPESIAYRKLVDTISVELGGPRHPRLS
ncbi:hypothetical protein ODJ79_22715 [Actinoplanes sp. KI2]|uniref:hypothetical protein n=1 Tax=Actinoplanes sp. KI2 TaxID=2983315 RepID=UPI0021D610E0|nr:hypothetical protein [Actinoplanes sp. KI2]MCU7726553.1 hypothetical protein [Actinoplanes sp. KI2]